MSDQPIVLLSQMTAKEGHLEALEQALQKLVPLSRQEIGCLTYEIWRDRSNERFLIVYERFTDQVAYDEHVNSKYVQDFVAGPYKEHVESHWDIELSLI